MPRFFQNLLYFVPFQILNLSEGVVSSTHPESLLLHAPGARPTEQSMTLPSFDFCIL